MGRRRIAGVKLPEGVEKVRAKGRTYYYWNPGRGTGREGVRARLPDAQRHPVAFLKEIERLRSGGETIAYPARSVGMLVERYVDSLEFKNLSESTQASYGIHLRRFKENWGMLQADSLGTEGVLATRNALEATPGMANHMLSCGRTLWGWGILRDYAKQNPFQYVPELPVPDRGHVPWPGFIVDAFRDSAPPDLVRMMRLGIMTCQRESDLIRMGPEHHEELGIWCRPTKTRKKRKAFCIPLTREDAALLRRWAETPITFTNSRWLKPIERHRADLYLYSPKGAPYTTTSLRARYHRWLRTDAGKELCRLWQEWLAEQIRKYEWEIDPEDVQSPTIHGLRGTGILVRFVSGLSVDQIANEVGMSKQMVDRYMRFRDQVAIAAAGRARLKLVKKGA